jgi:hypothetical protein
MADEQFTPQECPICGARSEVEGPPAIRDGYTVQCGNCGTFGINLQFVKDLREKKISDDDRLRAAAVIFERRTLETDNPDYKGDYYRLILPPGHKVEDGKRPDGPHPFLWDDLLGRFPCTVSDRLDRCLVLLCNLSKKPGQPLDMGGLDGYSGNIRRATFSEDVLAMEFILKQLAEDGQIELTRDRAGGGVTRQYTVKAKGWNRVAELERERGRHAGKQAFVAMWFSGVQLETDIKGAMETGIKAAGYVPLIVDSLEHTGKIDDRIIAEIRKSRFVVADFSGHRPNVYYEAGFAKGLGIEVIWTCRKEDMAKEKVHFDTRQYNHIVWETPGELSNRLEYRIRATITGS